jgi:hypothetical protein
VQSGDRNFEELGVQRADPLVVTGLTVVTVELVTVPRTVCHPSHRVILSLATNRVAITRPFVRDAVEEEPRRTRDTT